MKKLFTILLFALFCLPLIQYKTKIFPRFTLYSFTPIKAAPVLSYNSYINGQYQKLFETFYLQKSGFFQGLSILNNFFNYSVFKIADGQYKNNYMGKEGAFFEQMQFDDKNGLQNFETGIVERILKIKRLQDYLESQNKKFLIVIDPNKYIANPDWQSDLFDVGKPGRRRMDIVKPLLDKFGINYIQLSKEFDDSKHFSNTGAHLKSLSKCKAVKIIANYLNKKSPNFLPEFECVESGKMVDFQGEEVDLARILNVGDFSYSMRKTPEYEIKVKQTNKPLNALIVGTSFVFGFRNILFKTKALNNLDLLFYEKRYFKYRDLQSAKPVTKKINQGPDLYSKSFLDNQDLVIFEITEHRISELGYEFINQIQF